MKKIKYQLVLLAIVLSVLMTACSSGRGMGGSSKKCGCGLNKGFVGY
jgi:hypothetical protein